jgi:hypothetical protein
MPATQRNATQQYDKTSSTLTKRLIPTAEGGGQDHAVAYQEDHAHINDHTLG